MQTSWVLQAPGWAGVEPVPGDSHIGNLGYRFISCVEGSIARVFGLRKPDSYTELRFYLGGTIPVRLAGSMGCVKPERVPCDVKVAWFRLRPPLVKRSRLASRDAGGVGKELSSGWAVNYVVGCTHGCPFCYAAAINTRYPRPEIRELTRLRWGGFLALPLNFGEALAATNWSRWAGEEILLSSMHDPYLAPIADCTRKILAEALAAGVRVRIQTRSTLVLRDIPLMAKYRDRVRLQVSIATFEPRLYRLIEPYASPPGYRIKVLKLAKKRGIPTGVIVSPILPPVPQRRDVYSDLLLIARALAEAGVDIVYGESLHKRGANLVALAQVLDYPIDLRGWDEKAEMLFTKAMEEYGLRAVYWREEPARRTIKT